VSAAMSAATGLAASETPAVVKPSQEERFGDYQANGVMALAKRLKKNPRELAQAVLAKLEAGDLCESCEIAGPGFINFRLKASWLGERLLEAAGDPRRLGVDSAEGADVTVVDFSGPNIAKEMHVGHLRSTIIGDVIARVLEFWYGDPKKVIRQNHVGDWGTQFGMLICYYNKTHPMTNGMWDYQIADLEQFYKEARKLYDSDPEFAQASKEWVRLLQQGDTQARFLWTAMRQASLMHCQEIYDLLHVKLGAGDIRGESDYNEDLPKVIEDLKGMGLYEESDGAGCVFLEGFKTKEGERLPLIVQKSDGAYLYATTDLAAIRYRVRELQAKRIIYVTDARQKQHFEMVFACARKAGWAKTGEVSLEHVPFGSVLGEDGKPFKTRSGENIKLKDLLREAQQRARKVVEEKNPELTEEQKEAIARAVGIGAVKYADLSNHLGSDYVFRWDRMLAMEGNTAPYMQYAYARVQSIFRKGQVEEREMGNAPRGIALTEPGEMRLAIALLRFGEAVEAVARELQPHLLTNYLFDLAQAFSGFYTQYPVLKAEEPVRGGRLLLCRLTADTLRKGLELLGIGVLDQM